MICITELSFKTLENVFKIMLLLTLVILEALLFKHGESKMVYTDQFKYKVIIFSIYFPLFVKAPQNCSVRYAAPSIYHSYMNV